MNDEDERRDSGHRHACEVPAGIDRELAIERWRDRQRGLAAHHQRVSIGRRFRRRFGGDHSARTGAILHHDRLTQRFRQLLRENPGRHVRAAACRKTDEHLDRPVRVLRGLGMALNRGYRDHEGDAEQDRSRRGSATGRRVRHHRFGFSSSGTAYSSSRWSTSR